MDVVKLLLFNHVLPTIVGSALTLFLVLFFMKIFFIKRPTVRHTLLFIPLVKPLSILIGGFQFPGIDRAKWRTEYFHIGQQAPDPLNLVPRMSNEWRYVLPNNRMIEPGTTGLFLSVASVVLVVAISLIAIRWFMLYAYRKRLAASEEIDYEKHLETLGAARRLSEMIGVRTPKLVFAEIPCPFVIGIRNPAIVLPSGALDELSSDEVEAVLAHELAHIKRRDNLKLWASIILRDIVFFNPIAWLTFKLLETERERAADHLAAQATQKPVELADSIVKIAEKLGALSYSRPSWAILRSDLTPRSSLNRRVNDLLHFKPRKRLILRVVPLAFLFLLLFYVRTFIAIRLPGENIFLFFG